MTRRHGEPRDGHLDRLPDARDGLTRIERVVLHTLHELERELGHGRSSSESGGRSVPTIMLYGRVVETIDISVDELQATLIRLMGRR